MAQSVKRLTLDFRSGHGLAVRGLESRMGVCPGGVEPAWDSLSPSLSLPLLRSLLLSLSLSLSPSLKINKLTLKRKEKIKVCERYSVLA